MGATVEDFPLAATAASSDQLDWTADESPYLEWAYNARAKRDESNVIIETRGAWMHREVFARVCHIRILGLKDAAQKAHHSDRDVELVQQESDFNAVVIALMGEVPPP